MNDVRREASINLRLLSWVVLDMMIPYQIGIEIDVFIKHKFSVAYVRVYNKIKSISLVKHI